MLARMAGSGAGIPARMAGFRTGARGSGAIRGVGITLEGAATGATGGGTMLDGSATGARGAMLETRGAGVTLMAAMESARTAGSGAGIPANTEGSSTGGEAATS